MVALFRGGLHLSSLVLIFVDLLLLVEFGVGLCLWCLLGLIVNLRLICGLVAFACLGFCGLIAGVVFGFVCGFVGLFVVWFNCLLVCFV